MQKHQPRTMVVRVHPHAWRWRVGGAAAALLVTFLVGYLVGASQADDVPFFNSPEERLRDEVAQLTVERDADQLTLRTLKSTLAEQAGEISEMREMLTLYRGVMLPEETGDVVVLRAPATDYDPLTQSLQVVTIVHRGASDYAKYEGELSVSVEGRLAEAPHTIDLSSLDTATESGVFPLRFQYLQRIQIAVSLPEGFVPEIVVSSVTMDKPIKATLARRDAVELLIPSEGGLEGAEGNASDNKER